MKSIAIEIFGSEVQVRGNKLFRLAQEKISARFQVEMQALDQRNALGTGKVRKDVHAEDAIEPADIAGTRQIHAIESHQAAQPWFHQQVRAVRRNTLGSVGRAILD